MNTSLFSQKKLSYFLLSLILVIFVLNYIAQQQYLYWKYWWFDIPMHFFGGFFLGFFSLYVLLFILQKKYNVQKIFIVHVCILILTLGVAWEVYEFFIDQSFTTRSPNILDTVSDLFFDTAGGLCVFLYAYKKKFLS